MHTARVLIAMAGDANSIKLNSILVENGYTVVYQAKDGHDSLRKIRLLKPDIAILNYSLPLTTGYEVAKIAVEDKICDGILLTSNNEKNLIGDNISDYNIVTMTKPISKPMLITTLDLMEKSRKRVRALEKEIEGLRSTLDSRKEIERAKGLLMKHLNLSEPDAFKRIQKQSMDKGIPMKEIAKSIILAYDI